MKKREKKGDHESASAQNVVRKLYRDEFESNSIDSNETSDNEETVQPIRLKENKKDVDKIEFYDNGIPYFESMSTKGYGREDVLSILIMPDINRVSLKQPLHVRENATFLVRLKSKGSSDRGVYLDDLKSDGNGRWDNNGNPKEEVLVDIENKTYRKVDDLNKHLPLETERIAELVRCYRKNRAAEDFKRVISYIKDSNGDIINDVATVQYFFDNQPHQFIVGSHGNSKSGAPFQPTKKSTMKELKTQLTTNQPKRAIASITKSKGGPCSVGSEGDLPRGPQQAYDANRRRTKDPDYAKRTRDILFSVLLMASSQEDDKKFIRRISLYPEPVVVLATESQLDDLVRFCTAKDAYTVMFKDTTFNCGNFFVTPISYKNLMLQSEKTGKCPVFVGPTVIHFSHNLEAFAQLGALLVQERPELKNTRVIGTDHEPNLFKGLSIAMTAPGHVECIGHFHRNVKRKLQSLGMCGETMDGFLRDIFGATHTLQMVNCSGLLSSESEGEFDERLAALTVQWDEDEKVLRPGKKPEFSSYFLSRSADIKKTMIKSVRSKFNIEDVAFTTNAAEAVNHVIKTFQDYNAEDLPKFIQDLHDLIIDQEENAFLATINQGRFRMKDAFKKHCVDRNDFYRLPEDLRKKKREKFFQISRDEVETVLKENRPIDLDERDIEETDQLISDITLDEPINESEEVLRPVPPISVDCRNLDISIVQEGVLEMIWSKAQKLLNNSDSIKQKPLLDSQKNEWDMYQVSSSNIRKKGSYDLMVNDKCIIKCGCPMYKNKEIGICSHRVALAERLGILEQYLENLREHEHTMENNLTDISLSGVNKKAAGKKSAIPRRSSQKTSHMQAPKHTSRKSSETATVSSSKQATVHHSQNSSTPSTSPYNLSFSNQTLTPATPNFLANTSNQAAAPQMQSLNQRLPTFNMYPPTNPVNLNNAMPPRSMLQPFGTQIQTNPFNPLWAAGFPRFAADSIMLPNSFQNPSQNQFAQPRYLQPQQYFPRVTNHSPAGRPMLPKPLPPPTTNTYTVKKKPKSVKTCVSGCRFGGLENEDYTICRSERDYFPYKNDDGSHSWHLGREQPRYYHTRRHCLEARNPAFFSESLLPIDAGIITDTLRDTMKSEFGLIV